MKKTHIFNQYFGIGDIMFIEPIMRRYFQSGHIVVLPVLKRFLNIQPYFPYIKIMNKEDLEIDYDYQKTISKDGVIIHPVRWSREYFNSPLNDTMRNKYKMFNLPLDTWREFTFLRHRWKEDKLIEELGVDINKDYVLINKNFHTFENKNREFKLDYNIPIVEMGFKEGYTLFDWTTIIENASEIHGVNTSTLYLFETLDLKAKEIHLYSRNVGGRDFKQTEYLRTKDYILHD